MLHEAATLIALLVKHVDDLKIAGSKPAVLRIISELEKVFGKLKVEWHNFTNCGVRHCQDPQTLAITLDQDEYIKKNTTIMGDENLLICVVILKHTRERYI